MSKEKVSFSLVEKDEIKNFIAQVSTEMFDYIISRPNSEFILFYKYLTHSDLIGSGKQGTHGAFDKNLLYYLSSKQMREIEQLTQKEFPSAHQSNIGLSNKFYSTTGLPDPRTVTDANGKHQYNLAEYADVYLVNSSLRYFTSYYTKKVFEKLDKSISGKRALNWNFDSLEVQLSDGQFTSTEMSLAVHGLGMTDGGAFSKLRFHMFKGDILILLYEKTSSRNKMFILLEKAPIFFNIIGERNRSYTEYQERVRARLINRTLGRRNAVNEEELDEEVTRTQQNVWRKMLAEEMMTFTTVSRQVFCPLTYITADFDKLGALFVASHIKGFSDENTTNEEKYDINNGLLLSANADALFDKHLITIDENKNLVFSFLLEDNAILKSQLLLLQPIFRPILNEERMRYLKYHKEIFDREEEKRRGIEEEDE